MTKYFKGNIIDINNLPNYNYDLNIVRIIPENKESFHLLDNTSHKARLYFRNYTSNNLKKLVELINRIISVRAENSEKENLDKIMIGVFSPMVDNVSGYPIIFEKLYDENGNTYGKELISGAIFPINLKYSSFDVKYSSKSMEKVYYDMDHNKGYYLEKGESSNFYYLSEFTGKWHEISKDSYSILNDMWIVYPKKIDFDNKCHTMILCENPISFNICLSPKMIFSNNQRIDYVIGSETLANELEVKNYLTMFDKGFGKSKRKREYENKINNYALSNYLDEIHFVSDNVLIKERVNESTITKEMKELEFLLFKLKSVSKNDYETLYKEYSEILNQSDTGLHVNTLSLNSIISLQNRAELAFMCHGGDSKRIIAYLENQVNNYLDNYNSGSIEKTSITINDLDKLSNYFLNGKNSYTIKEQNQILRCLSLLYFFEIYENKDILNSNDLANSYIADNVKRILVIIGVLHDEGIIKNIPNSLYDINNLDEFLEFIKKIEFNDIKKDGHILIKKMQQ